MNTKQLRAAQNQPANLSVSVEQGSARVAILVVSGLALGLFLLILALNLSGGKRTAEAIPPDRLQQLTRKQSVSRPPREESSIVPTESSPRQAKAPPQNPPPAREPQIAPYLQQLVANLSKIDLSSGRMTPEQIGQWKQTLQQLKQQGGAALPAIREFLGKNLDVDFRPIADSRLVGYDTLRTALIDTMQQIGGPESISTALQTLQTTADPVEIAMLGKYLMQQSPTEYRETVLNAAREALAQAAAGGLGNRDMNSLFEFLQKYGDAGVVPDLEKAAPQWNRYVAMALAGLPDEAGLPALIRLAEDTDGTASGSREAALRSLAEAATRSSDAGSALLEQARRCNIQDSWWQGIASALTGFSLRYGNQVFPDPALGQPDTQTYRVSTGNQNYRGVSATGSFDPGRIRQAISTIDRLLGETCVNSNLAAFQALSTARASLVARLPR
jgi:hypothetical protein